MADEDKDDVARALERLSSSSGGAPTPQPKPRPTPQPKSRPAAPGARPPVPTPASRQKPMAVPGGLGSEDLASLAPRSSTTIRRSNVRVPSILAGVGLRRTLIPILLTGGVLLSALASIHFLWNSVDNPLIDLPGGVAFGLYGAALICWLLAAVNMAAVRRQIENSPKQAQS